MIQVPEVPHINVWQEGFVMKVPDKNFSQGFCVKVPHEGFGSRFHKA